MKMLNLILKLIQRDFFSKNELIRKKNEFSENCHMKMKVTKNHHMFLYEQIRSLHCNDKQIENITKIIEYSEFNLQKCWFSQT